MRAEFSAESSNLKRKGQKRQGADQADQCRRKRRRDRKMMNGRRADSVDLISQLPDHVIHHILSFLRCKKDVDRITVLSKRWKDIRASFMILDFDQRNFLVLLPFKDGENREEGIMKRNEMFMNHVNSTLKSRIEQGSGIRKFALRMTSYGLEMSTAVNHWIRLVSETSIQELDLCFPNNIRLYTLSRNVFTLETLTSLSISGCNLKNCKVVNLPNLRKLCLERLHLHEKTFEWLISGCPLIDDLRLIRCSTGFRQLHLSSDKLSRVDVHLCRRFQQVELKTPNLEMLCYRQQKLRKQDNCDLDLASCEVLKSLVIELPSLTDDKFQNIVSKLPVLEQLSLCKCDKLKSITVPSHRLRKLVLRDCQKLRETDIDSPNLVSFEYKGKEMPFLSMNPSGLKEANICLERGVPNQTRTGFRHGEDDKDRFTNLHEFLAKFDHSKGLKLVVRSNKEVIMVHEDMSKILVPPIYDIKLEVIKPSVCLEDLLDSILRKWHPSSLFIVSPTTITDFSERLYKKFAANKEMEPVCCKYNTASNKCWRHFLKGVTAGNISDGSMYGCDQNWVTWLNSKSSAVRKITAFELNWEWLNPNAVKRRGGGLLA